MISVLRACALGLAGLLAFGSAAQAATVGVAVESIGSSIEVGTTEHRDLLGGDAIKYFIPLKRLGNCVYGVDTFGRYDHKTCGVDADKGTGGRELSMFLRFDPVSTTDPSQLSILFEDLDLIGANDPWYFLESVNVLDATGTSLTGVIDDIASAVVTGNADTQQLLSLGLGVLPTSVYFVELQFVASSKYKGWNTPEYLIAEISSMPVVPLPAAGGMLLLGLGALGFARRRRQSQS